MHPHSLHKMKSLRELRQCKTVPKSTSDIGVELRTEHVWSSTGKSSLRTFYYA